MGLSDIDFLDGSSVYWGSIVNVWSEGDLSLFFSLRGDGGGFCGLLFTLASRIFVVS